MVIRETDRAVQMSRGGRAGAQTERGGGVPNEENLIPFNERTESEQREIAASGGRASGASRRRKRSLKEAADLYLSLPVADRRSWNKIARHGVDPEDIDNQMAMIVGLTQAAIQGDASAARIVIGMLGEDGKDDPAHAAENNLLDALKDLEEIDVSDLPEVE